MVITDDGIENLTKVPRTVEEIESLNDSEAVQKVMERINKTISKF